MLPAAAAAAVPAVVARVSEGDLVAGHQARAAQRVGQRAVGAPATALTTAAATLTATATSLTATVALATATATGSTATTLTATTTPACRLAR
ncbi:hypothetical protein, partial [Parafrankia sp. EUN1f]|uniref:hypothetical protein n=1 Tax=Parafrankia sp. EUN1f TaxID=102897 RepID=UPI0001C477F4